MERNSFLDKVDCRKVSCRDASLRKALCARFRLRLFWFDARLSISGFQSGCASCFTKWKRHLGGSVARFVVLSRLQLNSAVWIQGVGRGLLGRLGALGFGGCFG